MTLDLSPLAAAATIAAAISFATIGIAHAQATKQRERTKRQQWHLWAKACEAARLAGQAPPPPPTEAKR